MEIRSRSIRRCRSTSRSCRRARAGLNQSHSNLRPKRFTFLLTGEIVRRKNRKWVATAVALYLLVMWSAYRWGIAQRPVDGNIFDHIDREIKRKNAEEAARESAKQAAAQPQPTGESRLNAAGP